MSAANEAIHLPHSPTPPRTNGAVSVEEQKYIGQEGEDAVVRPRNIEYDDRFDSLERAIRDQTEMIQKGNSNGLVKTLSPYVAVVIAVLGVSYVPKGTSDLSAQQQRLVDRIERLEKDNGDMLHILKEQDAYIRNLRERLAERGWNPDQKGHR